MTPVVYLNLYLPSANVAHEKLAILNSLCIRLVPFVETQLLSDVKQTHFISHKFLKTRLFIFLSQEYVKIHCNQSKFFTKQLSCDNIIFFITSRIIKIFIHVEDSFTSLPAKIGAIWSEKRFKKNSFFGGKISYLPNYYS